MATIEKRINSNGVVKFRALVRRRGYPKQSATFDKITDAKRWATNLESAIHEQRHFKTPEANRRTVGELITRYQKEILPFKSSNLHFLKGQHNQLEWWRQQLGAYFLADLTASRIVEARSKLNCAPSTINRYMSALSHALSVAIREWEWLDISPISKIRKLREPRGRLRYLSEQERALLLSGVQEAGNHTLHLIIVLALSTGARKGELLGLKWSEVDFERRRLIFLQTKNGDRRNAPLGDYALSILQNYKTKACLPDELVFQNRWGSLLRIDSQFSELVKRVGIENFRFHDLRHSAASYLAMSGATMTDIAEVLGHKTLSMVKRYTHLSDSHTSQVVTKMNANIFNSIVSGETEKRQKSVCF